METYERLVFMLLQDFFDSVRPHRLHKFFLLKSAVYNLYHLKSNNILGQGKTTNTEELLSMIDFV